MMQKFSESGNIDIVDGTLKVVLDYDKRKRSIYTDISVYQKEGSNEITVTGYWHNWEFFIFYGFMGENPYKSELVESILPEYLIEENVTVTKGILWWKKTTTEKRKRVKDGWVEYKNTNIKKQFITNQYIIIE